MVEKNRNFRDEIADEFLKRRWADLAMIAFRGHMTRGRGAVIIRFEMGGVINENIKGSLGYAPAHDFAFTVADLEKSIREYDPEKQIVFVFLDASDPNGSYPIFTVRTAPITELEPAMIYYQVIQGDPTGLSAEMAVHVGLEPNDAGGLTTAAGATHDHTPSQTAVCSHGRPPTIN